MDGREKRISRNIFPEGDGKVNGERIRKVFWEYELDANYFN